MSWTSRKQAVRSQGVLPSPQPSGHSAEGHRVTQAGEGWAETLIFVPRAWLPKWDVTV